jgi:hypothetical protein
MKKIFLTIICALALHSMAQDKTVAAVHVPEEKEKLKINLNEDGSHYFQATFSNQTWLRFNENNPGTKIDGIEKSQTLDIGLRRTRIQMFGQIADKVFVYFQFGQNNFNAQYNAASNRKNAAFFHDALCEYNLAKGNLLKLGAGLTIANGLSRFSQPSVSSIMTMDVPVFAQATVDQTDQFSRKLSIYARGQIYKLDYRFSLSDPFPITSNGSLAAPASKYSSFTSIGRNKQAQGYIIWQFLEHESHVTPYMTGTYLGKKKVFNIAAGMVYQKDAMWHRQTSNDSIGYQDMMLIAVESFLDVPINREKGTAISAYAGYFITDYGTNYLRYNGSMNPANATTLNSSNSITGQGPTYGNAFPMFGTGQIGYIQLGYLLPKDFLGSHGQLMPYASSTLAFFDRLQGKNMTLYNAGLNWLIQGHHAKISLDWQNRPTYFLDVNTNVQSETRKNSFTIQYQIFI